MTAVYAALLSLARSLHQILDLEKYIDPLHKERIVSLHENVNFIIKILEDYSDKCCHGTLDLVGNGIRKASFEAQDFMDSYMCSMPKTNIYSSSSEINCDKVMSLDRDLNMALERIHFILEESMKMNNDTAEDVRSRTYSSRVDHPSTLKTTTRNKFVELDDDLNKIKLRLYESSATLQTIPIVGMGGIGKTTLARKAYGDLRRTQHFDVCAWITVSADYKRREMLSELLLCFNKSENELSGQSDDKLKTLVYQHLVGRRYLIVVDDIWSTKVWDDLRAIFPDDGSGSRILLTTRLSDAGCSSDLLHQMDFLNEDQSWKLLQERIFGQESCPLHLVEIGKKMAINCGGLPLTIVVVAGLISIGNTKEEVWENISESISSMEPTIELQCSKVVCLSYDRLPLWLKPCFLYITAFPEDSEVYVSELINLWVAEGFLKPSDQFSYLEDVGERYLEDLVNKNLILVHKRERDGKPATVGIHDLLREICITKAEEEGVFHRISSKKNAWKDVAEIPNRRISIHCTQNFHEWRLQDSNMRSILLFSEKNSESRLYLSCRQLSVLNASDITWPDFSDVISTLINLRYIAFALNDISCPHGFPASICKLPYLETIIARVSSLERLQVPYEIWEMPKLRRLIMDVPFHLSYPSDIGIVHKTSIQTLGTAVNFRFTQDVIEKLANLKSLKVFFAVYDGRWDYLNLNNLFRLQNLEELSVTMQSVLYLRIWSHAFPISLKKLSLCLVNFPWENMAIIGSLPNLQMLEMMGLLLDEPSEWTPTEGQFLRLKHFQSTFDDLVKWEVEKEHFPSLESLIFCGARLIDEIPSGIGEIDSLQLIELRYCKESLVNSAQQIQEWQHENGNDSFEVLVIENK